ncbi:MAG: Asp-tRNA(Asn)/Glu-tRNA(Gln) amidotransferase subunit GatA [Bacteroidia bacterium]|nr:Asp-tRNA(Asn)/Glu-tRNA(Gln) amidotransferase subunit GatA [Bacteroidia bacterium]
MKRFHKLSEIQQEIATGSLSCKELVDVYLGRIENQESLNIFVEVFEEEARQKAAKIDQKIAKGTAGRLAGLVLGIKDVLCYKGHTLTASSRILEGFESLFTSTAVQKLLDEDAIIIGRQSCDEFAMGSSNENSCYGPVRNPWSPDSVPGGSSGASAAAVAAGLCHASLGSDTGGSVRQPAGLCGVVGVKPTYGRVSRWGLIAYASSFDQIGPITNSVEDAALILEIMAGNDPQDNTSSSKEVPAYAEGCKQTTDKKYKIGYLKEVLESEGLDPEIKKRKLELIASWKEQGHELIEIEFPLLEYLVPCYYILTTAEASSNLSRYDGIRYGHRSKDSEKLEDLYRKSRSEGFGEEVQRRILLGTFVLSAGYYDAYYTQAMKVRRLIREKTEEIFKKCDFLFSPTSPSTAFKIGEKIDDPIEMFLADIFTVHANLAGMPALSLPLGLHSNQKPFGLQLMANSFQEAELLAFANVCMAQHAAPSLQL